MRLEWIEDVLAVHDTGSLRAAAEIRHLTASAFTRRIRAAEEAIGGELFDRANKPLRLRPHVVELIPKLRDMAASFRAIKNELSGQGNGTQVSRLICQHTLSVSWAPKVARHLSQDGMRLRIRSGSKDECSLNLIKNDSDIAIVYEDPERPAHPDDDLFERIDFGLEEFLPVAALRRNDALLRDIQEKNLPIVAYPRNLFLGDILERALSKIPDDRVSFHIVAESGLGPAVLEFVREGLGVGWLPNSLIAEELQSGEFEAISDLVPPFKLRVAALRLKAVRSKSVRSTWKSVEAKFGLV